MAEVANSKVESNADQSSSFVPKTQDPRVNTALSPSEEADVIQGAMGEFFTNRWAEWNVGEFIALEPAWTNGQSDLQNFDKALDYWIVKFGNEGNSDEGILKRIRETLVIAGSPLATKIKVEKPLDTMDLGQQVVIAPSTYFDNSAAWVPGSVGIKSRLNREGGIRAKGSLAYPLFSGDGRYAFVEMRHVKAGTELGQLHFFLEKMEGKWKTLAVGRMTE